METSIAGFDWDKGNREKCEKHGVPLADIEDLFEREVKILPDWKHSSPEEQLYRAIGITTAGRYVFIVFTIRQKFGQNLIRPISARYMHEKEIKHYEKENP